MGERTCSVAGCEGKYYGRGWCSKHYQRWRKHGQPEGMPREPLRCSADGCEKPHHAQGMCGAHYARWKDARGIQCSISACSNPVRARGWCTKHYWRWQKNGSPEAVSLIYGDDEARFMSYIAKDPGTGCWLWQGARFEHGYGYMNVRQKTRSVHRWAYEHFVGPIPDGFVIDHLCSVRHCANPEHLEAVTNAENIRRGPWGARA